MNVATWITIAIGSHGSSISDVMTPQTADRFIVQIMSDVTKDPDVILKARRALLRSREQLTPENVTNFVKKQIRDHFCESSCDLKPLPPTIENNQFGNLSPSDMMKVFYLNVEKENRQNDGWSCGYRSMIHAAALQQYLNDGETKLSHSGVGRRTRALLENDPHFIRSREYVCRRKLINQVVAALKSGRTNKENALKKFGAGNFGLQGLLQDVHEDFFIIEAVKDYLSQDNPNVCDAVTVLGKASSEPVRNLGEELVSILVAKLSDDDKKNIDKKAVVLLKEIKESIKLAKELLSTKDVDQLEKCHALDVVKGENNHDQKTEVDSIEKLLEEESVDYKGVSLLMLGASKGDMRKTLARLCKLSEGALEKANKELYACVVGCLSRLECKQSEVDSVRRQLEDVVDPTLVKLAQRLCQLDERLEKILKVLHNTDCPKIKASIAIAQTGSIEHNDEIRKILAQSESMHKDAALKKIKVDDRGRCILLKCYYDMEHLFSYDDKEKADRIIEDFQNIDIDCIRVVINRLKNYGDLNSNRKGIKKLLTAVSHTMMENVHRCINDEYPAVGDNLDDNVKQEIKQLLTDEDSADEDNEIQGIINDLRGENLDIDCLCERIQHSKANALDKEEACRTLQNIDEQIRQEVEQLLIDEDDEIQGIINDLRGENLDIDSLCERIQRLKALQKEKACRILRIDHRQLVSEITHLEKLKNAGNDAYEMLHKVQHNPPEDENAPDDNDAEDRFCKTKISAVQKLLVDTTAGNHLNGDNPDVMQTLNALNNNEECFFNDTVRCLIGRDSDRVELSTILDDLKCKKNLLNDVFTAVHVLKERKGAPHTEGFAETDFLLAFAHDPRFAIPAECIHILGNEQEEGVELNLSDPMIDRVQIPQEKLEDMVARDLRADIEEEIRKDFRLRPDQSKAHHFICNLSNTHWIMVSAVRFAGKKPIIVVLDSMNGAIYSNPQRLEGADTMISFVFNKFIREYY